MFTKPIEVLFGIALHNSIGGHTIWELLTPVDRHTTPNLNKREYKIIDKEYLLSFYIVGRISHLGQSSRVLPGPTMMDTPSRNQHYLQFMCIYVQLNFIDETLNNGQRPHTVTMCKLILESLGPVECITDHRVLQFFYMVERLSEIVSIWEVHSLLEYDDQIYQNTGLLVS